MMLFEGQWKTLKRDEMHVLQRIGDMKRRKVTSEAEQARYRNETKNEILNVNSEEGWFFLLILYKRYMSRFILK